MRRLILSGLCGAVLTYAPGASAQGLGEAIGRIFDGANLRTPAPEPPDFVVNSRPKPDAQGYVPYAPTGAAASGKKKTAKDFEAISAELNRAGALNRERAAHVARPDAGFARNSSKNPARSAQGAVKRVD